MSEEKKQSTDNSSSRSKVKFLFAASCIAGVVVMFVLIKFAWKESVTAFDRTIYEEQLHHEEEMFLRIKDIETQVSDIRQVYLEIVQEKKRKLSLNEKQELIEKLKNLEEETNKLTDEYENYHNDFSIQYWPRKRQDIDQRVGRVWGFDSIVDRFIRGWEAIIYSPSIAQDQLALLEDRFGEVYWHTNFVLSRDY